MTALESSGLGIPTPGLLSPEIEMGHLTEAERQAIFAVIRRDEALRRRELETIESIKVDINRMVELEKQTDVEEDGGERVDAKKTDKGSNKLCSRCQKEFGWLFNRGDVCTKCHQKVCESCRHLVTTKERWLCTLCFKRVELQTWTAAWLQETLRRSRRKRRENGVQMKRDDTPHPEETNRLPMTSRSMENALRTRLQTEQDGRGVTRAQGCVVDQPHVVMFTRTDDQSDVDDVSEWMGKSSTRRATVIRVSPTDSPTSPVCHIRVSPTDSPTSPDCHIPTSVTPTYRPRTSSTEIQQTSSQPNSTQNTTSPKITRFFNKILAATSPKFRKSSAGATPTSSNSSHPLATNSSDTLYSDHSVDTEDRNVVYPGEEDKTLLARLIPSMKRSVSLDSAPYGADSSEDRLFKTLRDNLERRKDGTIVLNEKFRQRKFCSYEDLSEVHPIHMVSEESSMCSREESEAEEMVDVREVREDFTTVNKEREGNIDDVITDNNDVTRETGDLDTPIMSKIIFTLVL